MPRVWGYVPPCGKREKAGGGRVGFGSLCQRNHSVRDEEPPPDCHQTLPLEGDWLNIHWGKNKYLSDCNTDTSHFVMNFTVNVWWLVSVFQRRKLIIECGGPSGKKHSFITESSKIAQYLLNLCSAQHKFHSEMTSRQMNHSMIPGGNFSWLCALYCFQLWKKGTPAGTQRL